MTDFTDAEKDTIRGGVMGALALVSQADPGFFDVFKESKAAAESLKEAPEDIRGLVTGGLQLPPQAPSKEELRTKVLTRLSEAMQVASKDPGTASSLRQFVLSACQHVAEASKGVSPEEQGIVNEIASAMGQGLPQSAPTGQDATVQSVTGA